MKMRRLLWFKEDTYQCEGNGSITRRRSEPKLPDVSDKRLKHPVLIGAIKYPIVDRHMDHDNDTILEGSLVSPGDCKLRQSNPAIFYANSSHSYLEFFRISKAQILDRKTYTDPKSHSYRKRH